MLVASLSLRIPQIPLPPLSPFHFLLFSSFSASVLCVGMQTICCIHPIYLLELSSLTLQRASPHLIGPRSPACYIALPLTRFCITCHRALLINVFASHRSGTLIQFVQSKGRARASNGKIVVILSEDEHAHAKQLESQQRTHLLSLPPFFLLLHLYSWRFIFCVVVALESVVATVVVREFDR